MHGDGVSDLYYNIFCKFNKLLREIQIEQQRIREMVFSRSPLIFKLKAFQYLDCWFSSKPFKSAPPHISAKIFIQVSENWFLIINSRQVLHNHHEYHIHYLQFSPLQIPFLSSSSPPKKRMAHHFKENQPMITKWENFATIGKANICKWLSLTFSWLSSLSCLFCQNW